jgi:hypothetical protein
MLSSDYVYNILSFIPYGELPNLEIVGYYPGMKKWMRDSRVKSYQCFGFTFHTVDDKLVRIVDGDRYHHCDENGIWKLTRYFTEETDYADIGYPINYTISFNRQTSDKETYAALHKPIIGLDGKQYIIEGVDSDGLTQDDIIKILTTDGRMYDVTAGFRERCILGKDHTIHFRINGHPDGNYIASFRREHNHVIYSPGIINTKSLRISNVVRGAGQVNTFALEIVGECKNFEHQLEKLKYAYGLMFPQKMIFYVNN